MLNGNSSLKDIEKRLKEKLMEQGRDLKFCCSGQKTKPRNKENQERLNLKFSVLIDEVLNPQRTVVFYKKKKGRGGGH